MEDILNCVDEDKLLEKFKQLYEKHKYAECVTYIEKKLSVFSKKFYDIMFIYLHSLVNSGNKEKALKLVKEELSMPYIPMNFEEKFMEIYKEVSYIEKESSEFNLSRDRIEDILSNEDDKNLIILAIVELCKLNIRDFIDPISHFFDRDVKNIYKVMLVDALRGQGVNNEFTFNNKGISYSIVPSQSENILESNTYVSIRKIVEEKVGNKELTQMGMVLENLMLYLSDIYPKKVSEDDYHNIACALHYYVSKMYDERLLIENYCLLYKVEVAKTKKYLEEIESACSI